VSRVSIMLGLLVSVVALPLAPGAPAQTSADPATALDEVRALYRLAVDDGDRIEEATRAIGVLEDSASSDESMRILASAYRGSLDVVRGKHAFWPHSKIGHVNRGLALLDSAVRTLPQQVEIRYLRLVSTEPLPFLFSRGESIAEDVEALARLLPGGREELPPDWWEHAFRLIADSEHLSHESWDQLTAALGAGGER